MIEDTFDEMNSVGVKAKVASSTLEIVERVTFILESTTYREVDMMLNQLQACFQAIRWLEPYLSGKLSSQFYSRDAMSIAVMGRTGTSICDSNSPCLQSSGALMMVVGDPSNRLESISGVSSAMSVPQI